MADVAESIGLNDTIAINDGGANAYVVLDNVVDFDPPNEILQTVQSKRLTMANARLIRVPTIFDPGETRIMANLGHAEWIRLNALKNAKTSKYWRFTMTDDTSTTVIIVQGYITSIKFNRIVADEIVNYELTVGHTGIQS